MIAYLPGRYLSGFFSCCQFHSSFFIVSSMNFMTSSDILYILRVYSPVVWDHIICLFVVNPHHIYIFRVFLLSLRICWSMYRRPPAPLVPLWHSVPGKHSVTYKRLINFFSNLCCYYFLHHRYESVVVEGGSFLGVFFGQGGLSFSHPFRCVWFL